MNVGDQVRNIHNGRLATIISTKPIYRGDTTVVVADHDHLVPCTGLCGTRIPMRHRTAIEALELLAAVAPQLELTPPGGGR